VSPDHLRPSLTTQRLEALSDGVIAIAATLLVLDLGHIEPGKGENVLDSVLDTWPALLAYVFSFAVIGLIWVAHHGMFERISSVDRPLLFLNLGLLMVIGFIPWPTSVWSDFLGQGGANAAWATALYSTTMTIIGLLFMGMWWHLARHPEHTIDTVTEAQLRRSLKFSLVSPVVYGLTIPLAFVSPYLCVMVYAGLSAYFVRGPSSRALVAARENAAAVAEPGPGPQVEAAGSAQDEEHRPEGQ
jgi:uncharacterized membrane protein